MKVIKCAIIVAEIFGEERSYYVSIDATIEEVMSALREITETAHFVSHQFTETTKQDYEAHLLTKS